MTTTALLDLQAQLRKELEMQKENLPPVSSGRISLKGKKFTLPGGSSSEGPLTCIVVDFAWMNALYEGVYNAQNFKPPVCTSIHKQLKAMVPDPKGPKPQKTTTCEACPMNQWGSDPKGGKGKACKNTARLMVVPSKPNIEMQPWVLDVPPTSMTAFNNYINLLTANGVIPAQVLTEMSFDPSVDYPKVNFRMLEQHDFLVEALELRKVAEPALLQHD